MKKNDKASKQLAPIWALLFSATFTLTKIIGQRYLVHREWKFKWQDAATAIGGALFGYLTFRLRYGNKNENLFTR